MRFFLFLLNDKPKNVQLQTDHNIQSVTTDGGKILACIKIKMYMLLASYYNYYFTQRKVMASLLCSHGECIMLLRN